MSMNGMVLPNGYNSCMVAEGLFGGMDADERRALRRARQAEHAFRVARGYESISLWERFFGDRSVNHNC